MTAHPVPGSQVVYLKRGGGRVIRAGTMPLMLKVDPREQPGHPMVHEQEFQPGQMMPAHTHKDTTQVSICTEGPGCMSWSATRLTNWNRGISCCARRGWCMPSGACPGAGPPASLSTACPACRCWNFSRSSRR